jgi:hypothetical protein
MLAFRLLLILTAASIAICAAGYLLGGDRRFLRWAVRILQFAAAAGLVFFAILLLERLA